MSHFEGHKSFSEEQHFEINNISKMSDWPTLHVPFCLAYFDITTPFTRTKKMARHPKFLAPYWRHSKLSTCKRIGTKQNLALVPEFLGVPRPPCRGSLGPPKPHLHELKDRHGTPKFWYGAANLMPRPTREVVSAPLNFRAPVPYYFWAHYYVYAFKIRIAVPKKLAAPYRNFGVQPIFLLV